MCVHKVCVFECVVHTFNVPTCVFVSFVVCLYAHSSTVRVCLFSCTSVYILTICVYVWVCCVQCACEFVTMYVYLCVSAIVKTKTFLFVCVCL